MSSDLVKSLQGLSGGHLTYSASINLGSPLIFKVL